MFMFLRNENVKLYKNHLIVSFYQTQYYIYTLILFGSSQFFLYNFN